MGKSRRANMMGQRVFIIALMASSLCVALPTTDLVVPEAKNAGTSGAQFVQSTLKSGGTEAQCRKFATETISGVNAGVTAEQGELDLFDTGAGCAQEGQSGVATATTNKANADDDVVIKTQAVTDATATQATACNAPVTMVVNLPTLTANTCYGYTQEAHYLSVQAACDAANTALSQANTALSDAQTAATDAQTALDAAVAEAARRMSVCHCNVQQEQAAAWTAAGTATASHVTEWKKAHEVLCALDQTTTCTVPTCPAVTQPTLAAGVADEVCSHAPSISPSTAPTTPAPTPPVATAWIEAPYTKGAEWFDKTFQDSPDHIIRVDKNSNTWLFYKRLTSTTTFKPFYYIFNNWFSFNNHQNTDFELYRTYNDALAGTNKLQGGCNYDDPGVGFPRDCDGGSVWIGVKTNDNSVCNQAMTGSGRQCNTNRFSSSAWVKHTVYIRG